MPNLCFTYFVVNISLSAGNSYYFLGNWVSLDQICALFIYFCYYPEVIVIILQAIEQK